MKLLRSVAVVALLSGCARKEFNSPYDPKNALPPPELHSPADGAVTADNPPEFIWSAVWEAYKYEVQIDDDPDFHSPEVKDFIGSDTCLIPSHSFGSPSYYWRLRAAGEEGVFGNWSSIRSFSVKYPLIGTHETSGNYVVDVCVSDGLACLVGGDSPLEMVDVSNPSSPQFVSSLELTNSMDAHRVIIRDAYAYVADYYEGVFVVDVSDPGQPVEIGHSYTYQYTRDIAITGDYLVSAAYGYYYDLAIVDISSPQDPTLVGGYSNNSWDCEAVDARGEYAYLACGYGGLQVVCLSDPSQPYWVGSCDDFDNAVDVFVEDNYAFVADARTGLHIVDVSDPSSLTVVGSCEVQGAWAVFVADNHAFLCPFDGLLKIVDVSQPSSPEVIGSCAALGYLSGVFVGGGYAYLACGTSGVNIVRVE